MIGTMRVTTTFLFVLFFSCSYVHATTHDDNTMSMKVMFKKGNEFWKDVYENTLKYVNAGSKEKCDEKLDELIKRLKNRHYRIEKDKAGVDVQEIFELAILGNPKAQYVIAVNAYNKYRKIAPYKVPNDVKYCRVMLLMISAVAGHMEKSRAALWEKSFISLSLKECCGFENVCDIVQEAMRIFV